jgi:outer membrane protein assembly factor BamB
MRTRWSLLFVALLVCPPLTEAADWPQWLGPERKGISQETGLLEAWPADGPALLWQIEDLGSGYGTPVVAGDRIYVLVNEGLDDELVRALEVKDGKQVWSTRIGKVGSPDQRPSYPGSRSTPTVDGNLLYVFGSDGDLACLEVATGKTRWHLNVLDKFGGQPGRWGYSESPLIDGDLLVCAPGGEEATLLALDKMSGDVVWKSSVSGGDQAAYASTIVATAAGTKQYVQFLGKGLVGVDAANGSVLWQYAKTAQGSPANIPTPVAHDGYIYSASNRGGGSLIQIKADRDSIQIKEMYYSPKLPRAIGGALLVDGYLYGTTGQAMQCVDFMTGEIKWSDRSVGAGSLCYVDGRLYVHGEEGEVALVVPSPDAYREKGRFMSPKSPDAGQSKAWAYPVVSNGRLYIRDFGILSCYDIKERE